MKKIINTFKTLNYFTKNSLMSYATVIIAYIVIQIMISGGNISNSLQGQLVPICTYVIMAVSLNLTVGISGELSLGHAGFMSVGAFTGIVASTVFVAAELPTFAVLTLAIIAGAFMAMIFGLIVGIPVLKLRGDYLAIVTLAFGEIIKDLLNNLYVGYDVNGLHFSFSSAKELGLDEETGVTILKAAMGATGMTKMASFGLGVILILITLFVVYNVVNSRTGRAIMSVRDNYIAAESVGINTMKYRLMAFVISAALAGMGGVLYGLNYSSLYPSKFGFDTSILILVFVVLGGMGNIWGSIIAAALLTVLPELLRSFSDYRMLVYAIVLILVMLIRNNPKVATFFNGLKAKIHIGKSKSKKEGGQE